MTTQESHDTTEQDNTLVGFSTIDDRGRVALTKATRRALHLRTGSSLAYVVLDGAIMLVPQDTYLTEIAERAARVLHNAGLSVDDLLTELPTVREEILRKEYGDRFVDALASAHAAIHTTHS